MQVIPPLPVSLAFTGASPSFIYAAWASGQSYAKNAIRRHNASGAWRDYRCKWSHTSSSANAPPNWWYWEDRGPSSTTGGYTYSTNVAESINATWASGTTIADGAVRYDPADQHDYAAPLEIASGSNTIRPSEAVKSTDPIVSARWVDLGAANAWAPFDYLLNSYLSGYDAAGALVPTVVFSADVKTESAVDRVCLAGMDNVGTITIKVYVGGALTQTVTSSAAMSGTTYGIGHESRVIPITSVAAGSVLRIEVSLARAVSTLPVKLAVLCVGLAHTIAVTEWGVETSLLVFSRRERDEVFGTVKFVERGYAKSLRATCAVSTERCGVGITGDVVMALLARWSGKPVFWDFNEGASDYDRLRIFGFAGAPRMPIQAQTYEALSIDIEGLVT